MAVHGNLWFHTVLCFLSWLYPSSTESQVLNNPGQIADPIPEGNEYRHEPIVCQGPLPTWNLTTARGWNPSQGTLQQLCASETNGGYAHEIDGQQITYHNLNFHCSVNVTSPPQEVAAGTLHEVAFVRTGLEAPLDNPRLRLYCRQRCFCSLTAAPSHSKPKGLMRSEQVFVPDEPRNSFTLRAHDKELVALDTEHGSAPTTGIQEMRGRSGFTYPPFQPDFHGPTFVLSHLNLIRCNNAPVPRWQFPAPYIMEDFSSMQDLCAVSLGGGNPGANAGAYCRPGDEEYDYYGSDVAFSDELTPRITWTWAENFRFTAAIRGLCWENCECQFRGLPKPRPPGLLFNVGEGLDVIQTFDGLKLRSTEEVVGKSTFNVQEVNLFPHGVRFGFRCFTKDCLSDPWPTNLLGPPPGSRKRRASTGSITNELSTCGSTCNGPARQQCRTSGEASADQDCKCVVASSHTAQELGYKTLKPLALCLNVAAFTQWTSKFEGGCKKPGRLCRHKLTGRGVGEPDLGPSQWSCPCNSTYASKGCCASDDGIVWGPSDAGGIWL